MFTKGSPVHWTAPALLLAALVIPASVFGQDYSSWIGKRVITHYGAVLQIGNQVVDDEERSTHLGVSGKNRNNFRVYRVKHVDRNWMWLKAEKEGAEGWVKAEFVIPYDQAIDYFTNQIRANPNQGEWYNRRGFVWKEKGEYDIAIADFNEAIRLNPGNEVAWNNRGTAWDDRKEYDKAIADYNEAIRLDPKYTTALNNRGSAWGNKKDYDKAIADYNEAVRLDPNSARAFKDRGIVWALKREYDKAIADYNETTRLDPTDAMAFYNRGMAWRKKKEHDKAIFDCNETIRLDPKYANAYIVRGNAWRDKKEYDKAIANYNEVIRLDPKNVYAYENRGSCWFQQREYDKAITDYNEAIRVEPQHAWTYGDLALLLATSADEKYRDGKKAVESATRACELSEWKEAHHVATLAAAYAEAGEFERAIQYQDRANKLFTDAEDKVKGEERLKLYKDKKPYRQTD